MVGERAGEAGQGTRVLAQDPQQPAGADAGLKAVFGEGIFGVDCGEERGEVVVRVEAGDGGGGGGAAAVSGGCGGG